jgi:hypothetical protein
MFAVNKKERKKGIFAHFSYSGAGKLILGGLSNP